VAAAAPDGPSGSGASPFRVLGIVFGLLLAGVVFATLKIRKKAA